MPTAKSLFMLPDDNETLARLIASIPASWAWIDAELKAPAALIASGQVARKTGFHIQRFHSIKPTLIGCWNAEKRCRNAPDIAEILALRQLPLFVNFEEAGFQARIPSFGEAQNIAAHFLRLGYRGWFSISAGCDDNDKHQNPAYVQMPCSRESIATLRPNWSIEIGLNPHYGGKPEMVTPILNACQSLGLKPVPEVV